MNLPPEVQEEVDSLKAEYDEIGSWVLGDFKAIEKRNERQYEISTRIRGITYPYRDKLAQVKTKPVTGKSLKQRQQEAIKRAIAQAEGVK